MCRYNASVDEVKARLRSEFSRRLDRLFAEEEGSCREESNRALELSVWTLLKGLGGLLLTAVLAMRCRRVVARRLEEDGVDPNHVEFRFGDDYEPLVTTTLGRIRVPVFAYRDKRRSGPIQKPAREYVFPLLPRCHSSDLLLEWETRLGSEHPFRLAQEELRFFTHDAVSLEDNTIARHLLNAAAAVDHSWLYKSRGEILRILRDHATVDRVSGKPILYMSSDAHALRRFVDETWQAPWKMANGIRLWCIDRATGETIHIGGEFTWGDCREVASIFRRLIDEGIVPVDGDYGQGVAAKLVWLSDGMPWFEDHVLPLFDKDAVDVILDVYHLLERAAECAASVFGKDAEERTSWYAKVKLELVGKESKGPTHKHVARKGHKKNRGTVTVTSTPETEGNVAPTRPSEDYTAQRLLDLIAELDEAAKTESACEAVASLLNYVFENAYRTNYALYRYQGLQIGSGAMESIHRTGSQMRLKRPGSRWLPETSQAQFNWRMLRLVGRWDEFWSQPDLGRRIAGIWGRSPTCCQLAGAA